MEYGLIGEHLGHSFSKEIHNKIADYDYSLKEIAKEDIDAFMKKADFKGINVTIPYKQTVIPYLDEIDEGAKAIGAVNTIVNKNGKLSGYNTDYFGMKAMIEDKGIVIENKKILILGTGGTCKTAKAVCTSLKAKEILVVSRSEKEGCISYKQAVTNHLDAEVIINTTPSGMYPNNENCPIEIDYFDKLEAVIDVIYNPLKTKLVSKALEKGLKATGGLYMLVYQAIYAYQIFFDTTLDETKGKNIYKEILSSKENIILTGMPTSGKTTVGNLLSEKTGRKVVDLDDYLVKKYQTTIPEIFAKYGEKTFRDYESEVVKEISKLSGIIISCGGGVILRKENIDNLKSNGTIYFIDRPLEKLIPTEGRPLAKDVEAIKKRYEERYDIYLATSDVIVKNDSNIDKVVDKIERSHNR